MWTFTIAFPMKVAKKNVVKGIRKCPQVMPARSNKGFGIYNRDKRSAFLMKVLMHRAEL